MTKTINLVTIAATLLVVALAGCKKEQDAETDFKFEVAADGKSVTITEYVGKKDAVLIPSQLQGLPVMRLGDGAFREKGIASVIIPNNVTEIGSWTFFGNQLTKITIGANFPISGAHDNRDQQRFANEFKFRDS
ncbi:MAG: leucine-rich repeat domain-containing protein [Fibromonadaceae bacterium]|jgi:hypothetical protein|nr:leucine-rich repeat domain-containing protein [Fibromonadaceae bacterium]